MFLGDGFSPFPSPMFTGAFPPPRELTRQVLPHLPGLLIEEAADFFGLGDPTVLFTKRRRGEISLARWAVTAVLIDEAGWSTKRVAKLFRQDRKAIVYGYRHAKALERTDPVFFEAISRLQEVVSPR